MVVFFSLSQPFPAVHFVKLCQASSQTDVSVRLAAGPESSERSEIHQNKGNLTVSAASATWV